MSKNIAEIFYEHGGYSSDSAFYGQDNYISLDESTGTYIPQGVLRLNALCNITASVDYTSLSSGNLMDDLIISELALSIADSSYDTVHIDPETGQLENKHWEIAYRYMLDMYGVNQDGEMVLPIVVGESRACENFEIATLSF